MRAGLRIQLLGEFGLTYDGTPVTAMNSPRLQILLAYLILHRAAPQPRQHLAFLFGPTPPRSRLAPTCATSGIACAAPCRMRIASCLPMN